MYTTYHGLTRRPFENTPDPLFFYQAKSHGEALASVEYGINSGKGLILVVGDIGTGKTTLVQTLLEKLDPSHVIFRIFNPRHAFRGSAFSSILDFFVRKLRLSTTDLNHIELMEMITNKLEALDEKRIKTVLIIDEAHLLSDESLQDIRLISNIETGKKKLIQIVLVGQLELITKLKKRSLQATKQRLSIIRTLIPFDKNETQEYIAHRLRVAGRESPLFNRKALSIVFKKSQGTPRLINQICDNSLLIGYAIEAPLINGAIVKEVISDMEPVFERKPSLLTCLIQKLSRPFIFGVVAVLLISLVLYVLFFLGY